MSQHSTKLTIEPGTWTVCGITFRRNRSGCITLKMPVFSNMMKITFASVLILLSATYAFLINGGYRLQPRTGSVHQCPAGNSSFVTVVPGGRLGNGIFEYLSTWTFAQEVDAVPVVPLEIFHQLSVAFQNFELPTLEDMASTCGFALLSEVCNKFEINHALLIE
jgi:hypothetical protein